MGPLISRLPFKPALCERLEACHWSRGETSSPDPVVKYDSAPQRTRARARQAGARGSVMRSLRGELPRMPGSTALCSYESWHACNRGNATSGRGLIEVYVWLANILSAWPLVLIAWNIQETIRHVSRGDFWDDVVLYLHVLHESDIDWCFAAHLSSAGVREIANRIFINANSEET